MQTRIFKVNYILSKRTGESELKVTSTSTSGSGSSNSSNSNNSGSSGSGSGNSSSSNSSTSEQAKVTTKTDHDFWINLETELKGFLGANAIVKVNPVSGVVLVKATPLELRDVKDYLEAMQLSVERQVMIEAKIIEVSLSEGFEAGVNWAQLGTWKDGNNSSFAGALNPGQQLRFNNGRIGLPGLETVDADTLAAGGAGFFGLSLISKNFAALLSFLETQGNVQVLSSPRIATLNNQKAVLKVGKDASYITGISPGAAATVVGGAPSDPVPQIETLFAGISLDITPQIDDDDNIVLHVHPTISRITEIGKDFSAFGGFNGGAVPLAEITISETDSIVRVQDGNIVAIGGLMRQNQNREASGLPGTTGSLFGMLLGGNRNSGLNKQELVILIKPTIIRNESSWKNDLLETQSRMQNFDPRLQNKP